MTYIDVLPELRRRNGKVVAWARGIRPCSHCGIFSMQHPMRRVCNDCFPAHHGLQLRAMAATACAVKRGDLPPAKTLACVDCGKQARDYDHRDYSKPLDVVPVCHSCNVRRGPAKKAA